MRVPRTAPDVNRTMNTGDEAQPNAQILSDLWILTFQLRLAEAASGTPS